MCTCFVHYLNFLTTGLPLKATANKVNLLVTGFMSSCITSIYNNFENLKQKGQLYQCPLSGTHDADKLPRIIQILTMSV